MPKRTLFAHHPLATLILILAVLSGASVAETSANKQLVHSDLLDWASSAQHLKAPLGFFSPTISTTLVISQIYGGGGNSTAVFTNDFIEVFNHGATDFTVPVGGFSVQYASATLGAWTVVVIPAGTVIPAGKYLLIGLASSGAVGSPLPTPDISQTTLNIAATTGKVALVSSTTSLTPSTCPSDASIIDFVGYGMSASCFEGVGPTPDPSNSTSVIRAGQGCFDSDNNAVDFTGETPDPRNSASASPPCFTTAEPVSVSGRVRTAQGEGIRNATVTLAGGDLPEPIVRHTGTFGAYSFDGLRPGTTYVVSVASARYTFASPVRAVMLLDSLAGMDFVTRREE
jgi:hypothetical protein